MEEINYCRTCHSSQQNSLIDIFQNNYDKLYNDLTQLPISEDDMYSKFICSSCIKELNHWEDFKKKCTNSLEEYFNDVISVNQRIEIKQELSEESLMDTENMLQSVLEVKEESREFDEDTNSPRASNSKTQRREIEYQEFLQENPIEKIGKVFCCNYNECNEVFYSADRFEAHLRAHFKLINDDDLAMEHETEPSQQIHQCDICGKILATAGSLKFHKECHNKEKSFKCKDCNFATNTKLYLENHVQRMHATDRPFCCLQCSKSFPSETLLKVHEKNHIIERNYQCSTCGKSFRTEGILKCHQDTHNIHRPFICEICNMGYKSQNALNTHSRIHKDRKPVQCDLCGKSYASKNSLRSHKELTHATSRPFECDKCSLNFVCRVSLRRHLKVHSDVRDLSCNICGAAFKHSGSLSNHMKGHKKNQEDT